MARSALQIAQQAYGELGLTAPSSLAGSMAPDAVQALSLLNREGTELADLEGAWPSLRGEQIITFVPGQEAYPFPTDYLYYRPDTAWDRTSRWRAAGAVSAQEWQLLRSGIVVPTIRPRFRIMDGMVHFDPVPSTTDTIVFEYVSANWCIGANATPQPAFLADGDTPLIPDDLFVLGLKWRLLAARGMNYAEERAAYDAAVGRKSARAEAPGVLSLNRRTMRFAYIDPPVTVQVPT